MVNFIYSVLILPLLIIFAHVVAIFSGKVRKPLFQRYKIISKLKEWAKKENKKEKKNIVIHSSSMGEFEHIKPLISLLNENLNINIVVTFFSPSGYENVKSFNGVSLFLYLPFDFKFIWKKFHKILNTNILIISKHDVWPNQIKTAKKLNITTILVNASLNEKSSRNSILARLILSEAYNSMDKIFVISKQDGEQFEKSFNCKNTQIAGDTKFDQVLKRMNENTNYKLISEDWLADNLIIILGSLWPQDAEHVLKSLPIILNEYKNIKIIIVPHEPTEEYIILFSENFLSYEFTLYSEGFDKKKTRILIINKIGILADLYKYADIAYIGGSFKQGIHNVIEPAIYGLPVMFGPVHNNSYEAKKLIKSGGAITINNSEEFYSEIKKLVSDEIYRKAIGNNAQTYANRNSGGTVKIISYINEILN